MNIAASRVVASILLVLGLGVAGPAAAQAPPGPSGSGGTSLAEIKVLYESAEYERALAGADEEAPALLTGEARDIEIYRALCLLALGKNAQATEKIEGVLRAEPLYEPSSELSRRLHVLVDSTRSRLLPTLVQSHYVTGKELFEAGNYPAAMQAFDRVLQLTSAGPGGAKEFADIRILTQGFRDLAARSMPAAKPQVAESAPAAGTPPRVSQAGRVVVPPVVVRQTLPPWPANLSAPYGAQAPTPRSGVLEVVITRTGTVSSVKLVERIQPVYDALLLSAARQWRYEPATENGVPIEYIKRVAINIR